MESQLSSVVSTGMSTIPDLGKQTLKLAWSRLVNCPYVSPLLSMLIDNFFLVQTLGNNIY